MTDVPDLLTTFAWNLSTQEIRELQQYLTNKDYNISELELGLLLKTYTEWLVERKLWETRFYSNGTGFTTLGEAAFVKAPRMADYIHNAFRQNEEMNSVALDMASDICQWRMDMRVAKMEAEKT